MLGLVVAGVFLFATDARAANTLYDMNRFLQEAHPFQNPAMAPAPGPAPGGAPCGAPPGAPSELSGREKHEAIR